MKKVYAWLAIILGLAAFAATGFYVGMTKSWLLSSSEDSSRSSSRPSSLMVDYAPDSESDTVKQQDDGSYVIRANGRVRGRSQTTLRNKYAGFVSKVYFYSHARVKKGDVILEYDDLPLRTSIVKLEHSIAEQQKALDRKKLNLEMTRLDPLPSEYRNLYWKRIAAKETLDRLQHEYDVYRRLHGSKIVTDLAFREKKQAFKNSEAELKRMDSDMAILEKGLTSLYIKEAELQLAEAERKLKDLKEELVLLKEEQKYYKIVAPYDGYCITNSDTVHGYYSAGTNCAEVHRDDRKLVYAYFLERDLRFVREGMTGRFISNQYGDDKQGAELKIYKINSGRTVYGNQSYFLVKFRVVKEPHPLRIDSTGTVEVVFTPPPPPQPQPEEAEK